MEAWKLAAEEPWPFRTPGERQQIGGRSRRWPEPFIVEAAREGVSTGRAN